MKKVLFFIHFILTINFIFPQEYRLNFIDTTSNDKKIKIFGSYKDLILGIEDSLISIKKSGNINAKVKSFTMIDSLNFNVEFDKNKKVRYIQITNESKLDGEVSNILNLYKTKKGLISLDEIEIVAEKITKKLSENGFPFAKVSFENDYNIQSSILKSILNIDYGSKRYLDKVIVKGYEDFPNNFINNIFRIKKNGLLDIDKTTNQSKLINKTNFARKTRDPEILFTNDSTFLYVYLEKVRRNSFDGFLSFDSDENTGKVNIQGFAKIKLINTFNLGEKINFDFRSQKNQERSLNSEVTLPYLFGSPFDIRYKLNLIQKDSAFNTNENSIDIDYNMNRVKFGIGLQKNSSNSESQIQFVENFESKLLNMSAEYLIIDPNDKFNFEKFKFLIRDGSGKKIQLNNETGLSKYKFEIRKKFKFSTRFELQSSVIKEKINSKNLVNNELLRFGGSNSIRGFDDNSIFADGYNLINTSLKYYLNDTIYIYSIFDLANYTNSILNLDEDIYSGGVGFSTVTENGTISISYSKGNSWGKSFNLKNAKINVIFTTFF